MNALTPAIHFMRKLRLLPKFSLVCAVLALPLILIGSLYMFELNRALAAASLERRGLQDLLQLEQTARQVQRLRAMEHVRLSGKPGLDTRAVRSQADANLRKLLQLSEEQALPARADLHKAWQALPAEPARAADALIAYQKVLDQLQALRSQLAAASGLAIDPDASSNALAQAVSVQIPELTQRLLDVGARGGAYIDTGLFAANEDQLVNAAAMLMRHNIDSLQQHYAALLHSHPELKPSLEKPLQEAAKSMLGFLDRTKDEVSSSYNQTSGLAYLSGAEQTADALMAVSNASARLLLTELAAREQQSALYRNGMAALILGVALLAAYLLAAFYLSFAADIGALHGAVQRAASGDLSGQLQVQSRDEIGELGSAFNKMESDLQALVEHIRRGSAQLGAANQAISKGNLEIAEHTAGQVNSLRHAVSTMRELSAAVRSNADSAQSGQTLVQDASRLAADGGAAVKDVVTTMAAVRSSASQIADIIGVIDGIAFQTNLLALNAAVEAARAGEHGRGFAVVAGEVRTLAQRSAAAAQEIKGLIQEAVGTVKQGDERVTQAGDRIGRLVAAVTQVHGVISDMAAAGARQAREIGQLEGALAEVNAMTLRNEELVERANQAARRLNQETRQLDMAVSQFKMDEAAPVQTPAGLRLAA